MTLGHSLKMPFYWFKTEQKGLASWFGSMDKNLNREMLEYITNLNEDLSDNNFSNTFEFKEQERIQIKASTVKIISEEGIIRRIHFPLPILINSSPIRDTE